MMGPGLTRQRETVFLLFLLVTATGEGQLIRIDSCTCPGGTLVYNCAIVGTGFTIWKGSAFNCPSSGSQIFLSHSFFRGSGINRSCNDGALFGRSIGISEDNTTYTSQLTVNLTADSSVVGERIECVHLSNGVETTIGSAVIRVASDALPPPTNVQLAKVDQNELTFSWRAIESNCSLIQYGVHSNCGTCNVSDQIITPTSETCSIEQSTIFVTQCAFAVQTIICGNISGMFSDDIPLRLKVPEPPQTSDVRVIPYYNASDDKLIGLDINFVELDGFLISSGVEGSATSYTIMYTDSNTNTLCDSVIIYSTQSCSQGVCTVPSLDPVPCSQTMQGGGAVDISILATNSLGTGPASNVIQVDFVNKLVDITFESQNRIVCVFQQSQGSKSCDITYGPCGQAPTMSGQGNTDSSNMFVIDLPSTLLSDVYCYTVNASRGSTYVLVQGSAVLGSRSSGSQGGPNVTAAIIVVLFVLLIVAIVAAIVIFAVIILRYFRHVKSEDIYSGEGSEVDSLLGRGESADSLAPRMVNAHIKFNIEDKPKELMNVLKRLKDINIKNIRSGSCMDSTDSDSSNSLQLKVMYIECESDLTEEEKSAIHKTGVGHGKSLVVCRKPKRYEVFNDDDSSHVKIEIKERIKHQPGALLELLEFVYSLDDWQHINITDIEIITLVPNSRSPDSERFGNVIVKFQSDVAQEWKDKFDRQKQNCQSIVQQTSL